MSAEDRTALLGMLLVGLVAGGLGGVASGVRIAQSYTWDQAVEICRSEEHKSLCVPWDERPEWMR